MIILSGIFKGKLFRDIPIFPDSSVGKKSACNARGGEELLEKG